MKKISETSKNVLVATAAALGMVLVLYFCLGVYPFGDATVITGDLNGQYVPFFSYWADVLHGQASSAYTFTKGIGGTASGLYSYYLSSPLLLLLYFCKAWQLADFAAILYAVKICGCAATMCFYLEKRFGHEKLHPALAVSYAFMAYNIAYAQSTMWLEVVALAPLVLFGVVHLLRTKKCVPLCCFLALSVLCNFYISFALCLFTAFYFLVECLLLTPVRQFPANALRFGGACLVGGLLPMGLLWQGLQSILQSKGTAFSFSTTGSFNFRPDHFLRQLLSGTFVFEDMEHGLPFIYCGMLVVSLVLLFFVHSRVPLREKLGFGALALLLCAGMIYQPLNVIWHGFATPVWFNYRYSFLLVAVLIMMAGAALRAGKPARHSVVLWALGAAGVAFCWVYFYLGEQGRAKILFNCVALALPCLLLTALLFLPGAWAKKWLPGILFVLCAGEVLFAAYPIAARFETPRHSEFVQSTKTLCSIADTLQTDGKLYRTEKTFRRTLNDGMLQGYNGLSHFSSTDDAYSTPLVYLLGYTQYPVNLNGTVVSDMVMSLQNMVSQGTDSVRGNFSFAFTQGAYTVWQNPYALSGAYTGAALPDTLEGEDVFARQNAYVNALLGREENIIDTLLPTVADDGATLSFTAPYTGWFYANLHSSTGASFTVASADIPDALFNNAGFEGCISLGHYTAGETVWLRYRAQEENADFTAAFYGVEETRFTALFATLQAQEAESITLQGNNICITVPNNTQACLLLTLPYNSAFTCTVNGVPVTPQLALSGFMQIPLPQGDCTVVLDTGTHSRAGFFLTLGALAGLCLFIYMDFFRKPTKKEAGAHGA